MSTQRRIEQLIWTPPELGRTVHLNEQGCRQQAYSGPTWQFAAGSCEPSPLAVHTQFYAPENNKDSQRIEQQLNSERSPDRVKTRNSVPNNPEQRNAIVVCQENKNKRENRETPC